MGLFVSSLELEISIARHLLYMNCLLIIVVEIRVFLVGQFVSWFYFLNITVLDIEHTLNSSCRLFLFGWEP